MDEQSDVNKPLLPPTLPRWWRVLPTLTLIMMISQIDGLILNDFIEYRYTNYYRVNSSSTQNTRELCLHTSATTTHSPTTPFISSTTSTYPISTTTSWNDIIQSSTARLNVFISLAATLPAILVSIFLGANCDRIGRKPLLALPFLGKTIHYFILTAVAYYDLSNIWIILSVMLDGLFGGAALSILSSFAYVTDCTNVKSRTFAITITDVFIGCSRLLPLLTIGIYLQEPKYVQSMVFILLLSLSGFVYCIVLQPESNLDVQHLNFFQQLKQVNLKSVTKMFGVFLAKRQDHKQRSLIMLVSIHLLVITMGCGHSAMYYLYLYGAPFCFDSFGDSLNSMAQTVTCVLLTIPFTLTIAKRSDHLILPMIGTLAYMTQLILFGIAQQIWMLYLAVCISALFNVLIPVIRSRITKLVEPDEYAVVFILASVFESGGYYAISAFANEVYRVTLTFYPGLVFFVFATVGAIAVILMVILLNIEDRSSGRKRKLTINE